MVCTWPSCAPDGRAIAFSGVPSGGNGHGALGVYLVALDGSPPRRVYTNEIGTDAIAPLTPHYVAWSPDSRMLAFIAQTRGGGLSLFVWDVASDDPPRRVVDGGPLYLSWSHDSRFLMIHSGASHYLADLPHGTGLAPVPGTATQYMAPAWSPTSNRVAIFQDVGRSRQILVVADVERGEVNSLTEVDGIAAVAWSPDGVTIAMARGAGSRSGYYGGLWLMGADTGDEVQLTDDHLLCFCWSPSGDRIAYCTPSEGAEGSIRWGLVYADRSGVHYLADFRPTQEQLTTLMFFDQYGQSHARWSRDGSALLFSGVLGYERVRGPSPQGRMASVFLADASIESSAQAIARGSFGAWVPE